jgi:hypothetical protein
MGKPMSQRAYSRHRGVTHRAVQKAIASGRIPVTADGKVDAESADRAWAANTDESKPRNSVSGTPKLATVLQPPAPNAVSGSVIATGYQASRAMHENYRARTARLEYERLTGTLVSADEVKVEAFNAARRAREALLAIADRQAPVLAAISDPAEIHRILTAEIRQVLEELARDFSS